ncbi:unnamed protein product [Orchesella dallaii]|uniref:Uncharacterized protein n=1 Tax=Orchesella dallaii TaxID=48710 RepID=A0ABP1Q4S6_9HEXA
MASVISGKSLAATDTPVDEDREWEKEDPNLLNIPELLYRECEKLPLPTGNRAHDEEFLETTSIIRELILDNKDFLDTLRRREGSFAKQEEVVEVILNLVMAYEGLSQKCLDAIAICNNTELWNDQIKSKIFSERSAEQILRWKQVLNSFLDGYNKIRQFISEEGVLNDQANAEAIEHTKKNLKELPEVLEELQECLNAVEVLMNDK